MAAMLDSMDQFRYERPNPEAVSSLCSKFGTVAALVCAIAASMQQFLIFSEHKSTIGRSVMPRQPSLKTDAPGFGLIISNNGEPFYNESYFRWEILYRVIFHGDQRNDEFPRQFHRLPLKTCRVYWDPEDGMQDPSPHFAGAEGKVAEMGCVDREATQALLQQARADGSQSLSPNVQIQGRYGEAQYWFVHVLLRPCVSYGEQDGISCADEDDEAELFSSSRTNVDLVLLDGIRPGVWKWSNYYFNLDRSRWTGHELFFKGILFKENDKTLPSVFGAVETTHLTWDSVTMRSQARISSTKTFADMYLRLASTVEEVEVAYFSLESVFEGIGAWHGFIYLVLGLICLNFNKVVDKAPIIRRRLSSDVTETEDAQQGESDTKERPVEAI